MEPFIPGPYKWKQYKGQGSPQEAWCGHTGVSDQGPSQDLGMWGKCYKNSGAWRAETSAGRGHLEFPTVMSRDTFSSKLVTSLSSKGGNVFLQDAFSLLTEKLFQKIRPQRSFHDNREVQASSPHARVWLSPKWQCVDPSLLRLGPHAEKDWKPWLWETRPRAHPRWRQLPVTARCFHLCHPGGSCTGFPWTGTRGDELTTSPAHPQIHSASPDGSTQSRENFIPLPFSFSGKFQPSEPSLEERKGSPAHENWPWRGSRRESFTFTCSCSVSSRQQTLGGLDATPGGPHIQVSGITGLLPLALRREQMSWPPLLLPY